MKFFEIEYRDGVAVLRIARPSVNAIDLEMTEEFRSALDEILDSERTAALVITGTERHFSAGLDLKSVATYGPDRQSAMIRSINSMILSLYDAPLPVVGAINGHAIAGGMVLALTCDYRMGAAGASQLGLTEARAGIPLPAGPMTVLKAELAGNEVRKLCLLARNVGPEEALRAHILDELQPEDRVLDRAVELARALAETPRDTYARVKRQVRGDTVARLRRIVEHDEDPLLKNWLSEETPSAAATLLKEVKK